MESRFVTFVTASAVFMTVLLLLDRDGLQQQLALGTATALFLWFFGRTSQVQLRQIVCCVIVATIGEVVLSLGWEKPAGLITEMVALPTLRGVNSGLTLFEPPLIVTGLGTVPTEGLELVSDIESVEPPASCCCPSVSVARVPGNSL